MPIKKWDEKSELEYNLDSRDPQSLLSTRELSHVHDSGRGTTLTVWNTFKFINRKLLSLILSSGVESG